MAQNIPGNVISKQFKSDEEVEGVTISDDGEHAVIEFTEQIWGISTSSGKILWQRKFKDQYKNKFEAITWVSPTELTVPTEKSLEWINATTGDVIASVPLLGAGLEGLADDTRNEVKGTWTIRPRRIGYVLVIPFEDGYQVFDLKNRKELYRSGEALDDLRVDTWGTTVMIHGDMDTALILDVDVPRVIVRHVVDGEAIDPYVFQSLFRHKEQLALLVEEKGVCYNANTGARVGLLGFDPSEVESYSVVLFQDTLCFLVSTPEFLRLFNAGSAKMKWSNAVNAEKRGTLVYAWPLSDNAILAEFVDDDERVILARINAATGVVQWEKVMMQGESEYESGHRLNTGPPIRLSIGVGGGSSVISLGYRPVITDSLGRQTYYSQTSIDSARPFQDWQFVDRINQQILHENGRCLGLIQYVGTYGDEIILQSIGQLEKGWTGTADGVEYSGEGLLRVNIENGAVNKFIPIHFLKHSGEDKFNATKYLFPRMTEHGTVILGSHTVVFIRTNGQIDTMWFPVKDEEVLERGDAGKDYVTVSYEDENDAFYTWKLDLQPDGIKPKLIGVSDVENAFVGVDDTTFAPATTRYTKGAIEVHTVMGSVPKSWPKPLWTISKDQLSRVALEDVVESDAHYSATGIVPYRDFIYVLGGAGFGLIDVKTGCFKSIAWEGAKKSAIKELSLHLFGHTLLNGAVFDLGEDVGLIRIGPNCELKLEGRITENRKDLRVVYSPMSSTLVVVDKGENRLDVYRIE